MFRNPEALEVLTISEVANKWFERKWCGKNYDLDCAEHHPLKAAGLLKYELVEDEQKIPFVCKEPDGRGGNGLDRIVRVYTANGDIIAEFDGKIDIEWNDGGYCSTMKESDIHTTTALLRASQRSGDNMREILFKAKRLSDGEWVEGNIVNVPADADFMPGAYILPWLVSARADPPTKGIMLGGFFEVDPSTVCAYTGLTDKNGKNIFEGDIISIENPKPFAPWICKTVYEDVCWWLDGQSKTGKVMLTDYADVEMEIIGSIHDGEGAQHE